MNIQGYQKSYLSKNPHLEAIFELYCSGKPDMDGV